MNQSAIDYFIFLTELSFDYGLIDLFIYEERIAFIADLQTEASHVNEELNENFLTTDQKSSSLSAPPETQIIAFLTTQAGVLGSTWKFTLGDPDYFPSIPHGHLNQNEKIKLDSYLGYTYDTSNGNMKLKREDRAYIVKLWNDAKFRDFAVKQIHWFISQYPRYIWRVMYPTRIPIRRP